MIYGIGIDIEEIDRLDRGGESLSSLANRILTETELNAYQALTGRAALVYLANRWSAKEAYSKAFGTGIGKNLSFKQLEIASDALGKPGFVKHPFEGNAFLSISHTKQLVMTEVILERMSI
ncbi:holo-[acyl-carrier-protein] synthase [Secundilactobacillus oryzae JCM 18671]|uniref:Holo-[acyl-carrier-protein] synthase n=1 Tax=Secundilactobacillus oryzae JCM 18671 TaxID=1291743 RepID=A0A081BH35_9LACO|nr:holo-ACP synthase [Secundilactobacillus oryzae]GAK47353.1 holo-[acyl-carrier-protein] synthase [Secundilactobacillus oryzae JCM 18671]